MKREEVKTQYKWATEEIYASDELWEEAFDSLEKKMNFAKYVGKLNDRDTLLEFLKANDEFSIEFERIMLYSNLKHDEDASVSKYSAYDSKIEMLYAKYAQEVAFYEPELASLDESYLKSLLNDKDFSDYDYQFRCLIKNKPHVLPVGEEKLMALASESLSTFANTFGVLDNVDLPLPEIEYEGKNIKLTHGTYGIITHGSDRNKRKEAYEKYYATYNSLLNTITSTYFGSVKKDVFLSRAYKFNSCLEMALFQEDVDKCVYENLLSAVDGGVKYMHRYISDRKKLFGYDKLYFYDLNAPLVSNVEVKMDYDKAFNYVIEGLAPLGKEYQRLLKLAHDNRWIDVEETEGKRSGAYSAGIKAIHPFVLLNYKPTTNDIFTIAHELGHSLHSYFTNLKQPYAKSSYKIFVAEVASTVNEVLLLKHMLANAEDVALKRYLLSYYLDTIRATLYRQTMFAEFEYKTHSAVENGEPLTKELMCSIYAELGKKYYGDDIEHDYNISCEWARVPHFYRAFYVYKYATGITSAINIANRILKEGQPAIKDYFEFLSGGCATDPVSLLKLAGVDLTTKQPFDFAMKEFAATLEELEKLSGING